MAKRIKEAFEKIAYAGLKPQGGRLPQGGNPKLAPVRGWVESRLTKSGSSDPLYLSNRTFSQKLKAWSILGVPAVLVLGGLGLALFGYFDKTSRVAAPPVALSSAEIADKTLPDLNKGLRIESQHDLEVDDVHVVLSPTVHLVGVARNKTDHEIAKAELVFDLTDMTGSRQGAVTTELRNIASKSSRPFEFAIEQSAASFALVREVRVH